MAGQVRKAEVEHHQVGLELRAQPGGLGAVVGLADDLETATQAQRAAHESPDVHDVVHEQDADGHGSPAYAGTAAVGGWSAAGVRTGRSRTNAPVPASS